MNIFHLISKLCSLDQPYYGDSEGGIIFINSHLKKMRETGVLGHTLCWWRLCLFGETASKNSAAVVVALNSA